MRETHHRDRSGDDRAGAPDAEFEARAIAHWNNERTAKVTGGHAYPILPGPGARLLRALGLLNHDATMSADAVRKYGQINHLVTLLEPALLDLCRDFPLVRLLDAGCGSSYLTYLLAWCFEHRWKHPAEIVGVDENPPVIEKCRERLAWSGLKATVHFEVARLEAFDWQAAHTLAFPAREVTKPARPHAVVALHACDTATDDALALAMSLKADFIAVAPCCQADLARRWGKLSGAHTEGVLAPVWNSPHLRREAAAVLTDSMRMLLLRACGYEVTATEFVPSSHTPKNTLLRAVRRGNYWLPAIEEYAALRATTGGVGVRLEELLPEESRARFAF